MFGFLKDKLKSALGIFKKKVEKEVEEEPKPILKPEPKPQPKPAPKPELKKEVLKQPEPKPIPKSEVKKEVPKKTAPPKEEIQKPVTKEVPKHEPKPAAEKPKQEPTVHPAKHVEIKKEQPRREVKEIKHAEILKKEELKHIPKPEVKVEPKKPEIIIKQEPKKEETKHIPKAEVKVEVKKPEPSKPVEIKTEQPKPEIKQAEIPKAEPEKKKGFFHKIFGKKEEKQEEKIIEKTEPKPATVEEIKTAEEIKEEKEEFAEKEIPKEEAKKGFFSKISDAITKKTISEEKFDEMFWDLEVTLLENNVAVEVIEKIKDDLKKELVGVPILRTKIDETIENSLKKSITELFDVESYNLVEKIKEKTENSNDPYIIVLVGVNGSGKTTTIAKLVKLFRNNNLTPVIAAGDTFRAAAIDQLEKHANNLGVKIIKHDYGSDSAAVAFDAIAHARAANKDVVLIDTAGRLHSNINLMEELKKVIRVAKPDSVIFIGESITGNDCVEQAKQFNEAAKIDGIILAKADVDEKGGAAISISYVTKKPILYLGVGQGYDDLKEFDSKIILETLGLA